MNTADLLREKLHYDPATGDFTWLKTTGGKVAGTKAGSLSDEGYWKIGFGWKLNLAHRLAWLYMTGEWPKAAIDHRNGIRTDNRWENLREATWLQNAQNKRRPTSNKSGLVGACWHPASKAWRAQIQSGGRKLHLGTFASAEAAHVAYLAAKARLHTFQPTPRVEGVAA